MHDPDDASDEALAPRSEAFQSTASPPERFRSLSDLAPRGTGPGPVPVPDRPVDAEQLRDLLDEARQEGAEASRSDLEAELAQLREAMQTLAPTLQELAGLRRRTLMGAAEDIADLVRLFAKRVVGDALAIHPEALPALVKDAVAQLPEAEDIVIAVAPQAAEALTRALDPDLHDHVTIDPEIRGGAVVRTRYASLDATLRTAEQGLESAVQDWLSEQWWVDGEGG